MNQDKMLGMKLIGPFKQIVTLRNLSMKGPLADDGLEIIENGYLLVKNGKIVDLGSYADLKNVANNHVVMEEIVEDDMVLLPGFVDVHTHICFGGSRAKDFALRNSGKTYLEIAAEGGGIWSTVLHTRASSFDQLKTSMLRRMNRMLAHGITSLEVKSGYGLDIENELKMLRIIKAAREESSQDVIATCLAAHLIPTRDGLDEESYLSLILNELVPIVKREDLASRFDIFIEQGSFGIERARRYLAQLKSHDFQLTVHGDQFTVGGSQVAIDCGAVSVDHLEASGDKEIAALSESNVIPVVLPGASIGLGCSFAPARKLLDAGCSLAIASDWNPGSAPQGDLLAQASIISTFEKLSTAEVFAGLTFRAAAALRLMDRGRIDAGMLADFVGFPTNDYREILYHQGGLRPSRVWKGGEGVYDVEGK